MVIASELISFWISAVKPFIDWTLKLKEDEIGDHNPFPDIQSHEFLCLAANSRERVKNL